MSRPMRRMSVVAMLLVASVAHAQESDGGRGEISGALRLGYWSSTRDLDAVAPLGGGMVWVKARGELSVPVSVFVEGWASLRGPTDAGKAAGEVREAYVDVRLGRLDVRAGRQIIAWGRADGVNPTDNLTADDLTMLTPDDDDRRLGGTAVRATYYVGDVSVTGVWLPEFRGHRFALPPAPGMKVVRHRSAWSADQWATRVEQTGRAVDWSVSYFRGRDVAPDVGLLRPAAGPESATAVSLSHHRITVFGADMAANVGSIGVRAEAAYVETEDREARDPFVKNPFLFVVVGGDRTFGGSLNLNVQYLLRVVRGVGPAAEALSRADAGIADLQGILSNQTQTYQHGASFRLARKWLRETLEGECAAVGFFGPGGIALQPRVTYAVTDRWRVLVGGEWYRGESSSSLGLQRLNSTVYLEARRSY